ncbi:hypothetical protein M902_2456 [Bacteriovorax sp. BAL6_X]|uniref:hypothetical protein n=1 Tax=Bacteriovorax sp. BAL6_X TaxID=1201290 RepID=UPI0003862444|nr:hypothetical protein [Bacteriovorax sp. BAL6_X]EPZ52031.1 hypothetical protein M902_2456 [Bacteriovorax sp. BAL6_X]
MDLLVFAHRGEAQTFLKEMDLKSHPEFNDLYLSGDKSLGLVLTGEGPQNVMMALTYAMGLLKTQGIKLNQLINLGICASFNKELRLGEIFEIRTIYGQGEFKSFQCLCESSKLDLITANERILDSKLANSLSHFAPLADREAWAIGLVSKKFQIPLRAFKLISDHVTDAPICEYIKEHAQDYSQELYRYFLTSVSKKEKPPNADLSFLDDKNFYFTLSLEREVTNLIKQILVKYEMNQEELLNLSAIKDIKAHEVTPKKKALELRDFLKEKLYPTRTKIIKQLDNFVKDTGLEKNELTYDPSLEKVILFIRSKITSETELMSIQKKLSKIDWNRFNSLMNGEEL